MLASRFSQRRIQLRSRALLIGLSCAALTASCDQAEQTVAPDSRIADAGPRLTAGSGSTPTFIGQATYADIDKVKRIDHDKKWQVELNAKGGLDVVIRSFAYNVGAVTGWHKHPGPVLIQVIEGTVTFYEADDPCTPIVVTAGHGYIDTGEAGHIGRNLSGAPAKDITINLSPPGTPLSGLRIDMPEPPGAAAC